MDTMAPLTPRTVGPLVRHGSPPRPDPTEVTSDAMGVRDVPTDRIEGISPVGEVARRLGNDPLLHSPADRPTVAILAVVSAMVGPRHAGMEP